MESASLTTFIQGRHSQVITRRIAEWGPRGQVRFGREKEYNTVYLSGDQEDKLVPLRTLQGVLYTTGYETITNY
jgi:hypothetical protein